MKYKTGDKVRIKTKGQMEKEFGYYDEESKFINCDQHFSSIMEEALNRLDSDRILTINHLEYFQNVNYYYMREIEGFWTDDMIDELVNDK
jgi:hypothetical protein